DEERVREPPVDHAPGERVLEPEPARGAPQLVEARARGGAREVRVLSERDRAGNAVGLHARQGVLALRPGVSERHVEAVRRGPRREPVEPLAHAPPLPLRPTEDGAAAADLGVVRLHRLYAPLRDEGAEDALRRELDDLLVG